MSRIGDGLELGMTLLQPLLMRGWKLHERTAFAGGGRTLFILANDLLEVKREGATLGDVAVELFEEAAQFTWAIRR